MKCIRHALFAAALVGGCIATASAYAADEFKGVTVNIMTFTGPQIAEAPS